MLQIAFGQFLELPERLYDINCLIEKFDIGW